jgi:GT2 family glycosyltransferase
MTVFAIIVSYNGKQWYDRCFESLRASKLPVQVVVIDNASSDHTVEYIKKKYPEIILIESDKNLGFGQANNKGMRYSLDGGADYVFLLNQDAWIEPDTLSGLVRIHQAHTEYGILSPIHLNAEKDAVEKLLLNRIVDYKTTDPQLINDLYFNKLLDVYDTKYVNAAAWLLPRKTLETVGGFDPIFYHYGEDDNYLNRVFYHHLKVGICPKLRIVHDCNDDRKLYDQREEQILLMIHYTNVNNATQLQKELRVVCWKVMSSVLKFRNQRARTCWRQFNFIRKNRKRIQYSIQSNKEAGQTWL